LFERERERESIGQEGQRERGQRDSQVDSTLRAEPNAGLDLTTVRS